jgi:hypothetical protein
LLLTVAEFRQLVSSSLGDEALQLLLDAAEQAITSRYGALGTPVVETLDGGQSYLFLRRRADTIVSLVETNGTTDTTLAADDWRIRGDGVSILRLGLGTNRQDRWGAPVVATYVPLDDEADRKRVQLELVKLDQDYAPGVTAETIGAWTEQRSQSSVWNYQAERAAIIESLVSTFAPGFA